MHTRSDFQSSESTDLGWLVKPHRRGARRIPGERTSMGPDCIRLRQATERDVPALIRLLRRSWLVSWAPELPFEAVQAFAIADPARSQAESMWPAFLVAVIDDVLVGMIHVSDDCVEDLNVDPRAWSKGVGSKLMDDAERQIRQAHGTARLVVRAFNERARTFYERRGWIQHRRYPGIECGSPVENIEMRKQL
jgi:GNAT superfamily N-acetyltransferase